MSIFARLDFERTGPTGWGVAHGGGDVPNRVFWFNGRAGSADVATTRDAGGYEVSVRPTTGYAGHPFQWDFGGELGSGEALAALLFVGGGAVAELVPSVVVHRGSVTLSRTEGNGTTILGLMDPDIGGVGVQALDFAVGSGEVSRSVGAGLVGVSVCTPRDKLCSAGWESPDGRSGSYAFAGPPGTWIWRWSGVGNPNLAAWAPIGNDWTLFAGASS
ncbi:MAG: hypothetical protein HY775_07885 [Acidobacteria bacterium]|nr:hypothetical protein [Acidobacteriota bacterium]